MVQQAWDKIYLTDMPITLSLPTGTASKVSKYGVFSGLNAEKYGPEKHQAEKVLISIPTCSNSPFIQREIVFADAHLCGFPCVIIGFPLAIRLLRSMEYNCRQFTIHSFYFSQYM